jgi:MarR family transcriptional regulator, lower aerobic nicotinate degradation pathway regulator
VSGKPSHGRPGKRAASPQDQDIVRLAPLESLVGFLLRCASNIADASYYKQVGSAEITPRQFAVLLSLRNSGPMTQAALCGAIRMDRSTINEMVPRMIERELISKSNAPDDKRAIHLSITAHGLTTVKELLPTTALSQDMILAALPKEYRRIFKHCLEMIIEANEADLSE